MTKIPVLLLKTISTPDDRYQEYFSNLGNGTYNPIFIPVLQHQMIQASLDNLSKLIQDGAFRSSNSRKYGGIIFTSQRAVEAFTHVLNTTQDSRPQIDKETVLYVVGPATSRAVKAMYLNCPILGEETGNGEALAAFMLNDYNNRWKDFVEKPSLLFLVGEQRRDIIPKTLQSDTLPVDQRIVVEEMEVYATVEHPGFEQSFQQIWSRNNMVEQWVAIFSPSGSKTVLQVVKNNSNTRIATIGPTTKAHLMKEFKFEPHVCASNPTPEALADSIHLYRSQNPILKLSES